VYTLTKSQLRADHACPRGVVVAVAIASGGGLPACIRKVLTSAILIAALYSPFPLLHALDNVGACVTFHTKVDMNLPSTEHWENLISWSKPADAGQRAGLQADGD
jgi:hypothetical protein